MSKPERRHDERTVATTVPAVNVSGGTVGVIGDHATVVMPRRSLSWPMVLGSAPRVASAFQPRTAIIEQIAPVAGTDASQHAAAWVLSGTGGVGKTQIAAGMFASSSADLRVWVNAESRESVLVSFAEAAIHLDLADVDGDPEQLAGLFLGFLAATNRAWLVVLDNIDAVPDLAGLWPPAGGHLIVTTRRRDAALSGAGRTVSDVGVFMEAEANNYLHERISPLLEDLPEDALTDSGELAEDLGRLPLALAQAAAVIIDQGITCTQYRTWFADRTHALDELFPTDADADGYAKTVATTWELAVTAADRINPTGLARPMAVLIAMLDPAGAPETVLTSQAACTYLSETTGTPVTGLMARKALRALHRLSLIDHDLGLGSAPAVRMHNLTGRAIQQTLSPEAITTAGRSVADGLLEIWPPIADNPLLAESLRSNTTALASTAPTGLWDSNGAHPLLFRSGQSLNEAGLIGPAIQYHQELYEEAKQRFGPDHPVTLNSQNNLACAYESAGKLEKAIPLHEQTLTDRKRVLGPDHPDTLGSQNDLACAYESSGKLEKAISLYEQTLTDRKRVLGPDHPHTLNSQNNLAYAYRAAGKLEKAILLYKKTLTDSQRILGPDHPDTLSSQNNLAYAYRAAGKLEKAIPLHEQTLTDRKRVLGPDHPHTLNSQNNLACAYESAGKLEKAISLYEQTLTDRKRVLGPDHPDTLGSQNDLACAYESSGKLEKAISLYEQTLTDRKRVLGPDHPHTLNSQNNLAYAYRAAGKLEKAILLYKKTLTDSQRILGPDHPDTLSSQNNLAYAYRAAGKLEKAIPLHEQTLTDRKRVLGPDHPHTLNSQNNLACAYESAGKLEKAISLYEQTLTDRKRVLGPDHPDTLGSQNDLACAYESSGKLEKAISLYEQTLTDRKRVLGPDHPHTLNSQNNLAYAYRAAGKLEKAILLFEQTLTNSQRVLGQDHPYTLGFRNNLASAYQAAGKPEQVTQLFEH
ncbi:tetratricopeptide repeat protein [Arthrobacter burdickii]|uniref:Tetratricopeptide repeat protein n=1 Tax=Arthrobacter burdickii TaxID=3035920 RepID=A0ABT8K4E2_9MICC|nr:tetratricopeptide repeat protein [Arthrobacter burdickii]MDN4612326.1 tetratricopeptide repeat protein [Arthrobacter burdickii]